MNCTPKNDKCINKSNKDKTFHSNKKLYTTYVNGGKNILLMF